MAFLGKWRWQHGLLFYISGTVPCSCDRGWQMRLTKPGYICQDNIKLFVFLDGVDFSQQVQYRNFSEQNRSCFPKWWNSVFSLPVTYLAVDGVPRCWFLCTDVSNGSLSLETLPTKLCEQLCCAAQCIQCLCNCFHWCQCRKKYVWDLGTESFSQLKASILVSAQKSVHTLFSPWMAGVGQTK